MITDFYLAFAPVSFSLLGLWFIVVQTRHRDWIGSREHRLRASGVSLRFALPGLMSLLSLVDAEDETLWRASFAVVAVCGAMALVVLARNTVSRPLLDWAAVALFVVVAAVAIFPALATEVAPEAEALQVEGFLLSLLLFLGITEAWLLMFDEVEPSATG